MRLLCLPDSSALPPPSFLSSLLLLFLPSLPPPPFLLQACLHRRHLHRAREPRGELRGPESLPWPERTGDIGRVSVFQTGCREQRGKSLGTGRRGRQELGPSPSPLLTGKSRGPAGAAAGAAAPAAASVKPKKCDGVPAPRVPSTFPPGAAAPGYPTSCGSSWDCGWMLQLQETQLRGRLLCWERRRRCNIFKVSQTLWLHWPPWSWRQTELMFYTFGYRFEFSPPHAKYLKPLETHDLTINDCAILSI
ncbi:uncharacterized protein LOC103094721 [Monodelphis domestica]|uniref:uncharacterized protein LOC103094721 n=1 Tax=Monodelphis domestica TaxID=13616 RepID=UPI0004433EE1|nr:uncharacterized protein LOC103094721 [Monodelphis domestica]